MGNVEDIVYGVEGAIASNTRVITGEHHVRDRVGQVSIALGTIAAELTRLSRSLEGVSGGIGRVVIDLGIVTDRGETTGEAFVQALEGAAGNLAFDIQESLEEASQHDHNANASLRQMDEVVSEAFRLVRAALGKLGAENEVGEVIVHQQAAVGELEAASTARATANLLARDYVERL